MPAYNPMKKHMEKLDEWGSASKKKYTSVRDAGPGASISDRFNTARGKEDPRWKATTTSNTDEDQTNIVPQRRVGHLPQAPGNFVANKAKPPPPPVRSNSAASASTAASVPPPAPPRTKAPPPPLPRRMDNENGIDQPPPSYGIASTNSTPSRINARSSHLEFSKFTEADKQDFFNLLDEVRWSNEYVRLQLVFISCLPVFAVL